MLILSLFAILGDLTLFMLGLKLISDNASKIVGERLSGIIYKATLNPFSAIGLGSLVTAVFQSAVATNMVLISLVEKGIVSFMGACAVVIGTNVGTTVTAQLVSLSFGSFDITAFGAVFLFFGFLLSLSKRRRLSDFGSVAMGFGLVFVGIKLLTSEVETLYVYPWFKNIFLIKSPAILLLNGFFITAICQSSSVVSTMLVILSQAGLITLDKAIYLLLGANIGTCVAVIVFCKGKSEVSAQVAVFNLVFNIVGALFFMLLMLLFRSQILMLFSSGTSNGRAVANFHTFFNIVSGLVVLPILSPLTRLSRFIVSGGKTTKKNTDTKEKRGGKRGNYA